MHLSQNIMVTFAMSPSHKKRETYITWYFDTRTRCNKVTVAEERCISCNSSTTLQLYYFFGVEIRDDRTCKQSLIEGKEGFIFLQQRWTNAFGGECHFSILWDKWFFHKVTGWHVGFEQDARRIRCILMGVTTHSIDQWPYKWWHLI